MTEPLTLQSLFDQSILGLEKQEYRAAYKAEALGPSCVYRTEDGDGCGIGVMLTDEEINVISDRYKLHAAFSEVAKILREHDPVRWELVPKNEYGIAWLDLCNNSKFMSLARDIQQEHDTRLKDGNVRTWFGNMLNIAHKYKLNYDTLKSAFDRWMTTRSTDEDGKGFYKLYMHYVMTT